MEILKMITSIITAAVAYAVGEVRPVSTAVRALVAKVRSFFTKQVASVKADTAAVVAKVETKI
jgi:hypothetical protein